MKILAGAVVRQDPTILAAHLKTMKWQEVADEHTVNLCYVVDQDPDEEGYQEVIDLLTDDPDIMTMLTPMDERPSGAEYIVDDNTHHWNVATFQHLARLKQLLLDRAREEGYDAVWLVDTDLLCDPYTLQSLINCGLPVVSGVFWTQWSPNHPPLPQVWQRHPYELATIRIPEHVFLDRLHKRDMVPVAGLGACTLINTEVLDHLKYWPFLDGLPEGGMWQGEDRHFCVRANQAHIPLMADGWPDIYHVYRPSYIKHIPEVLSLLQDKHLPAANIGDLVSFTLEELEDAQLAGRKLHVRGRLGRLDILPEIEIDLQNLAPGQDCLTPVNFPLHYPAKDLRGQTRLMQITLLAVKRYLPHIGLPTAISEFDERYYSPAQIRTMRASKVLPPYEHSDDVRDNSSGQEGNRD